MGIETEKITPVEGCWGNSERSYTISYSRKLCRNEYWRFWNLITPDMEYRTLCRKGNIIVKCWSSSATRSLKFVEVAYRIILGCIILVQRIFEFHLTYCVWISLAFISAFVRVSKWWLCSLMRYGINPTEVMNSGSLVVKFAFTSGHIWTKHLISL